MSLPSAILVAALAIVVLFLLLPGFSELLALLRARRRIPAPGSGVARLVFLVPAHNEQLIIQECIDALVGMDYPAQLRRVVVVADNCSDNTAALARSRGAEVLERSNPDLPGKPRAIAWALDQLEIERWDACVIIDADSTVEPSIARAFSAFMPLKDRAIQAYYATRNERENWLTRLAGVLARCRYEVTYPVRQAAGLNCPMTGNGMCLGSNLLKNGGWQAFSLTENWELYASYTARGVPIAYARQAIVFSQEVRSMRQGSTQRNRWLAGRMGVLRDYWRPIVQSPDIGWHQKLDTLAELAAASPVIHLVLVTAVVTVALLVLDGTPAWILSGAALASLLPLVSATLIVIARHPEPVKTIAAFLMLPAYAVWRSLVALRTLVFPPERVWRKTERHRDSHPANHG